MRKIKNSVTIKNLFFNIKQPFGNACVEDKWALVVNSIACGHRRNKNCIPFKFDLSAPNTYDVNCVQCKYILLFTLQ